MAYDLALSLSLCLLEPAEFQDTLRSSLQKVDFQHKKKYLVMKQNRRKLNRMCEEDVIRRHWQTTTTTLMMMRMAIENLIGDDECVLCCG